MLAIIPVYYSHSHAQIAPPLMGSYPHSHVLTGKMAVTDLMAFDDLQLRTAVAKEHALAVTRDYISQPRLSVWCHCLTVLIAPCCSVCRCTWADVLCVCTPSSSAYRTVSGVNGPLVILGQVKVRAQRRTRVGRCVDVCRWIRPWLCVA